MEPIFLELGEILLIHQDQLERYGGSPGIRDINILQSSTAMPRAGIADRYLHEDLFEMAAAYMFYLVRDHPFIDGNKRTGAVASLVFLEINDIEVLVDEEELESIVRSLAEGNMTKADVAAFLRRGTGP